MLQPPEWVSENVKAFPVRETLGRFLSDLYVIETVNVEAVNYGTPVGRLRSYTVGKHKMKSALIPRPLASSLENFFQKVFAPMWIWMGPPVVGASAGLNTMGQWSWNWAQMGLWPSFSRKVIWYAHGYGWARSLVCCTYSNWAKQRQCVSAEVARPGLFFDAVGYGAPNIVHATLLANLLSTISGCCGLGEQIHQDGCQLQRLWSGWVCLWCLSWDVCLIGNHLAIWSSSFDVQKAHRKPQTIRSQCGNSDSVVLAAITELYSLMNTETLGCNLTTQNKTLVNLLTNNIVNKNHTLSLHTVWHWSMNLND